MKRGFALLCALALLLTGCAASPAARRSEGPWNSCTSSTSASRMPAHIRILRTRGDGGLRLLLSAMGTFPVSAM